MAYEDNQPEFPMPGDDEGKRKSARHLPRFFRTEKNLKFLQSTIDQLLQPGVAQKIDGYVGRKTARAFTSTDTYLSEISSDRENYQLESSVVIKDLLDNVNYYSEYRDFINQIENFSGDTTNHSNNNSQEFYTWDPHINWDMFTNFREYYWLPNGPQTVVVPGEAKEIESTYTVSLAESLGDYSYIFTPDGLTNNPTLKLYRGVKYRFEINTPGMPLTFRTSRTLDDEFLLLDEVSAQTVEDGVIELTLGPGTPNEIWYVADNDINMAGLIRVANAEEATTIDVETEIVNKKYYTTRDGWALTNGLKIRFAGDVSPEKYANSEWYVEGVGDKIQLISDIDVEVSFPVGIDLVTSFDNEEGFDRVPFGTATGYPAFKDYITINRASPDGNFWSRYNRWFHKDVAELAATINNLDAELDQEQRANRPIIEFNAGIKLYNFGTKSKEVVDLIDDYTTDAFSNIEGTLGYNIDSVQLQKGMRVLFLADTDPLVNGKVFEVDFIRFSGSGVDGQITLKEVADSEPQTNENVLVTRGEQYAGSVWYYDGTSWNRAQEKTRVNQTPFFDIFDEEGISYANTEKYPSNTFRGTKIFNYAVGNGPNDSVLGFPLKYRSVSNIGDIVFDFDFNTLTTEYQIGDEVFEIKAKLGYLRQFDRNEQYKVLGMYTKANDKSRQDVILRYVNDGTKIRYPIDCYDRSAFIDDLSVSVYVNNDKKKLGIDYNLVNTSDRFKAVEFINAISNNANIVLKCSSSQPKNSKGYYEIAPNLERNPANADIESFTLGEVSEHVNSIVDNLNDFQGTYPGASNLRDLPNPSAYGRKFIKNTGLYNLAAYSLTSKEGNLISSLRYAKNEYAKFKRRFIEVAETLGFEGQVRQHVDKIMFELTRDKVNSMPFYFSDMIGYGASITTRIEIEDADVRFFALNTPFTLNTLSSNAVTVYLNGVQLYHGQDYVFNDEGFIDITASKQFGDIIEINEYENTSGSYIPPTPSKLGLYPLYQPEIFFDSTVSVTPSKVIRGHDGSIILAYNDYRDDLILELEKRIFNNVKVSYDSNILDICDYKSGAFRNTGFSRDQVYAPMIIDFVQWLRLVDADYTSNTYYNSQNGFTYNYSNLVGPDNKYLPGFWRGAYQHVFDTDRPDLYPWEMLGFSIKPDWWETTYGPAPYTRGNKILWEDLERGIVRKPGKAFKIYKKYARPELSKFIPVDDNGVLISPSDSNLPKSFTNVGLDQSFVFGDGSPVETAWTKSSEFPFALITSWATNNPAGLLSAGFDRSRQVRNILGQIVYSETNEHIRLSDLVYPRTVNSLNNEQTSGLINYIADYMASDIGNSFEEYKQNLASIKNCLAFKVAGYTDKSKFKLILDSRTPLNQGNVFVPEENYDIFLNTSSPIKTISYSGVIVTKNERGFTISGYDQQSPVFTYYDYIPSAKDLTINVGGISEPFLEWQQSKTFTAGNNIKFNDVYYKVKETHTTLNKFDPEKYLRLPNLPTVGGSDAIFRSKFNTTVEKTLPYGYQFTTIQGVVDFLLGYGKWLEDQGFIFDYFDNEISVINDWKNSAREFMFWTTQNWSSGAVIALSPVADEIKFKTSYATPENVIDNFFGYSLLREDGKKLKEEFARFNRENPNTFIIRPRNTESGIYAVQLNLVQKEHVALIDNTTIFGDVIYQPSTGYRQERIKVLGYKTADWDGTLNIPGFIYNQSKVTDWEPWQDYAIGDVVRYKEFFYTADVKISGSEFFNNTGWIKLPEKPESGLGVNFEYRINQFADFYDLDSDNFDVEQQRLAQHLIGYQKRDYLENIINDEVSQYKFYQGMIREKGTVNSLNKLFDVLSSADKESLDFFEEWAIKQAQYGAAEGFDEVEFVIDETLYRAEPQPFLLTNNDSQETDLVYRIKDFELYKKPVGFKNNFLPTAEYDPYTRTPGFVNNNDISQVVSQYNDITQLNISDITNNEYVWVGNENLSWNVYKHEISDFTITSLKGNANAVSIGAPDANQFIISLDKVIKDEIKVNDVIGLYDLRTSVIDPDDSTYPIFTNIDAPVEGFFKVLDVTLSDVIIETTEVFEDIESCTGLVTVLKPVKYKTIKDANANVQEATDKGAKIWLDTAEWKVLSNNEPYSLLGKVPGDETGLTRFAEHVDSDKRNVVLGVGSPQADDNGKIFVYTRGGNSQNWNFTQIVEPIDQLSDVNQRFGQSFAFSPDGKFLIAGSPEASNVKTKFKGQYDPAQNYENTEIVSYSDVNWEALVDIRGATDAQPMGSFGAIAEVYQKYNVFNDETAFNNIVLGNYPNTRDTTNHILMRAPADQYDATDINDTVFFDWYLTTTANQDAPNTPRQPFNGQYSEITEEFIEKGLVIKKKVDVVLYIPSITKFPNLNDQIETSGVRGYVNYIYDDDGAVTLYVEGTEGTWPDSGSLFLETGEFIGSFERVAPIENIDTSDDLGGYWWFDITDSNGNIIDINITPNNSDRGKALAVYNIIVSGKDNVNATGGNIYDLNNQEIFKGANNQNSYIRTLSYQGNPGEGGRESPILSDLFVVRAQKDLTDRLIVSGPGNADNDNIGLQVYRFPDEANGDFVNIRDIGLEYIDVNKEHKVYDLWDGYIKVTLEASDDFGRLIEPKVGQVLRDETRKGRARIVYWQRDGINATLFVKEVTGSWSFGSDHGQIAPVEYLGDPNDPDPIYQGTRTLGTIVETNLGDTDLNIGKLVVLQLAGVVEPVPTTDTILGAEYLIYKDFEILGRPTQPNIPSEDNFDWKPVYRIPADANGVSNALNNYGMYTIYERENITTYTSIGTFIFSEQLDNLRIGSDIKIAKRNDLYKAFIGCAGNNTEENPGRIYFLNYGTDEEGITYNWEYAKDKRYKGEFGQDRKYFVDDIVFFDGEFYVARTNVAPGSAFNILDWNLATSDSIRSIDYLGYVPNDTQFVPGNDSSLKLDQTNVTNFGLDFDVSDDAEVLAVVVEYQDLPILEPIIVNGKLTDVNIIDGGNYYTVPPKVYVDDGIDDSTSYTWIDNETARVEVELTNGSISNVNIINVGDNYTDTTRLIVDPVVRRKVLIYRNVNDNYQLTQEIIPEDLLLEQAGNKFGESVAVSNDGNTIAIGVPLAGETVLEPGSEDSGKVLIFKQVNGSGFSLSQELTSSSNISGEKFGEEIDFDNNMLYIGAVNAPSDDETFFDVHSKLIQPYEVGTISPITGQKNIAKYVYDVNSKERKTATTFDNGFTNFKNIIPTNGAIYAYDNVDGDMLYGQKIDYHTYQRTDNDNPSRFFGRKFIARNNHIYAALPNYVNQDGKRGLVLDYRRPDSTKLWSEIRTQEPIVDLSKIKQVMLYDKSQNKVIEYLDYIDPVQGKIAGIADTEIRFKTPFDPAVYTDSENTSLDVDVTEHWTDEQVGHVWWDLTNTKFVNNYQDNIIYKTNNFNELFVGSSIDVYEWIGSPYPPEEWDRLSNTPDGQSRGISGTTKYGNSAFVKTRTYDAIGQRFENYYYYWVKNKTSIPDKTGRNLSIDSISKLIEDPSKQGYKFITFLGDNSFALFNCKKFIKDKDVVLNIQYWTDSPVDSNIHNQYQILSEGLDTSIPYSDIENKWVDSLVGYDKQSRPVPDDRLPKNQRYGILNNPRQGWFINRTEALKQFIERVNSVIKDRLIVDEKNISKLLDKDPAPSDVSGLYDITVDTDIDLQFVGVAKARQAKLTPIVEDGKIIRIDIEDGGNAYNTIPTFDINGSGTGAEIDITINDRGQINAATVIDGGTNYSDNTSIIVRNYRALVNADNTIRGNWGLYELINSEWVRINSQAFDVTKYWNYTDWYDQGYNQYTEIDYVIGQSYELQGLGDSFGDIVKILDVGGSGWLLLEKINSLNTTDYTQNYRTIGKQNGTIQFRETLYNLSNSRVGFDTQTFDTQFFDSQPVEEIRIIINALKQDILTADLATEYNKLFFASLRYVFSEQGYVDWAFKTSFVKAQHNVGELAQRVTYKNDSLSSYEDYIKEVKPYKASIREFVSNYEKVEDTPSVLTDFDTPPVYSVTEDSITTNNVRVIDGLLSGSGERFLTYPDRFWLDNVSYEVVSIEVSDPGQGYLSAPQIEIEGDARAVASLGPNGKISSVLVTNSGSGYIVAPKITINGTLNDGGTEAKLVAKLGNSKVRNMTTTIKFDRVSGEFFITNLTEQESFVGTGGITVYQLKWPMDLRTNTIEVLLDGELVLSSNYVYKNVQDGDLIYGQVTFVDPPEANSIIEINYRKSITVLDAQDRINLFYNPTDGQFGKDLGQLMTGIDYGGVQVNGYSFQGPSGWDSDNWYDGQWDEYDEDFDEIKFTSDGSTLVFPLPEGKVFESNVTYNVYINDVRVDDNNWDGTSSVSNPYAIMAPIVGDGVTDELVFDNEIGYQKVYDQLGGSSGRDNPPDDVIITVRKSTADGSIALNEESFDVSLSGGDLAYTTAKGINAEEIEVDGDGFVTDTTSAGPEETVPGQVLDTLDITVYERPVGGSSLMQTVSYKGDGQTREFDLRQKPFAFENVIVKINGSIVKSPNDYRIDYQNKLISFYNAPELDAQVVITSMGVSGNNILDYDEFVADGSTQEFLTNVEYGVNVQAYVTVNGKEQPFELLESTVSYAESNRCVIRFTLPPVENSLIQFALFDDVVQAFSQITVDEFIFDSSDSTASDQRFELSKRPFNQQPVAYQTLVLVNDKVLNAGYSEQFIIEENVLEYQMKLWQVPIGTVQGSEIEVFLNGEKLDFLQDWTYTGAESFNPDIQPDAQRGSTIILNRGVAAAGDVLKVYIIRDGEYRFGYFDTDTDSTENFISTPDTVYIDPELNDGDIIRVYQFSNHDSQGIERENYDVVERTQMSVGSEGYTDYRLLTNGLINLRNEAVSVDYVWISLNGKMLEPTADYILLENKKTIKFITTIQLDDVIDIIHFSASPISAKFGWRQFKDMLNRTFYKRLSKDDEYTLAEPLNWYDRTITLSGNTNNLPEPKINDNQPGILFINGERIEYFRKEDNILKQIRRGTLGTGIKNSYPTGTYVYNQGVDSTIPYKDQEQNVIAFAGSYKDMSAVYDSDDTISVSGIAYNFNNNTAFPLGGQVATVNGTGFRPTVKVFVQDVECQTTYVNETQLTFITPALPVGAYDLVIYNDTETTPILRAPSSYVLPKAIPYVQILLPFAPTPNPISAEQWNEDTQTGWYKSPFDEGGIPEEYWEAQDIEVFANGRRLRKNPLQVYDSTLGQFSPNGDKWLEAEYAVNKNVGAYVRLTNPPEPDTKLVIVRKTGEIWNEAGTSLGKSNTEVATFLRGTTIDLPR